MFRYILKRIFYMVPILLGVNLLVFTMFFVVNSPDDMARQFLGERNSTPEQIERWKASRGYDLPLFWNREAGGVSCVSKTIFFQKSIAMFWGGFGNTDHTGQPIARELRHRVGPSFALALPIFLGSLLVNVFLGMIQANSLGSRVDRIGQFTSVVLMSISTLILIIFGQFVAAVQLRLCPVSGYEPGLGMVKFLLLPTIVGIVAGLGSGTRLYRTFFLEQISQDFVRTARAKGLPESQVLFKHVLKNALIPILTTIPLYLLMLFTGNLLLEKFFNLPGLGGYTIDAIAAQDFAIVRAMVFLGAVIYVIGLLLADIAYCIVDPRIKF